MSNETDNHSYSVNVAKKVGVISAVIYRHICFWIEKNRSNEKHFYDGKYWTYNSVKAFSEIFPEFTEKQIRVALDRLVEAKFIEKGNFNRTGYDRTSWFSLCENAGQNEKPFQGNPFALEGEAIPYKKTDNKHIEEKKENYIKERKEGGATAPCRSPNGSLIDNDTSNIDTPKNDSFALVSDFYPKDEQSIPPGNKKPSKGKIPTKQQVLAIYDAYPRKDAKQMGLRAIEKAIKKGHSPEMLLEKTNLYAQKMSWQDKQFIPYPSTWFNREQFLDDPSAWEAPASNNNGRYSSQRRLSPDQIKPRTKREILMTEPWRANELKDIDDDDTPF